MQWTGALTASLLLHLRPHSERPAKHLSLVVRHVAHVCVCVLCFLAEDVPLIESLEASKLLAIEIGEKVAEAAETEIAINDSRNKYRCARRCPCCVVCDVWPSTEQCSTTTGSRLLTAHCFVQFDCGCPDPVRA